MTNNSKQYRGLVGKQRKKEVVPFQNLGLETVNYDSDFLDLFLNFSKEMAGQYFKLRHDCFIQSPSCLFIFSFPII
jgi:hypothetical protein